MTLKEGVITQNDGVMGPFFKGHGESRYELKTAGRGGAHFRGRRDETREDTVLIFDWDDTARGPGDELSTGKGVV